MTENQMWTGLGIFALLMIGVTFWGLIRFGEAVDKYIPEHWETVEGLECVGSKQRPTCNWSEFNGRIK